MSTPAPAASLTVTSYGPEDLETVVAAADVLAAAGAVDSPWAPPVTPAFWRARIAHAWDGELPEVVVGRVGGADGPVVAVGEISVSEYDNTHLAWLGVTVHPEHRRRGHGTALLRFLEARGAELGRTSFGTDGWDSSSTSGFAERHGYEQRSVEACRVQRLPGLDRDRWERGYAAALAAAPAYELVRAPFPTPAADLPALAEMAAAMNDAPTDDLDIEDEVFSAERIGAYERAQLARGHRMYRVVARHRETGELAGHTVVAVEAAEGTPREGYAHQHDTSVVAAHRGHRLGYLLKVEMLRWLADVEPAVHTIETWNAASNDHMVGVNEELGYELVGRSLVFQRGGSSHQGLE